MTLFSSDSFNPMLVRDLRQGLRSSRFTLVFLLLQGSLAFFVVLGLVTSSTPGSESNVGRSLVESLSTGLVFFYVLGLPLAATFALSSEFLDNRIDLLKLTQMSARSLVWGKWFSLVVQGVMVFTSILPYLILMYFFGGVDVLSMLMALVCLLAFSALLVGLCVALSCFNSVVFRILLVLLLLWLTMAVLNGIDLGGGGGGFGMVRILALSIVNDPGIAAWLYVLIGLPFLWLVLEYGAFRLAPASENHDTPQRLILLGLIALAGMAMVFNLWLPQTFVDVFTDRFYFLAAFLALWVLMFAAATSPSPYPDTYRPFVRFGVFGRFLGRAFLYPGWPSSAPFIMLASAFFAMITVAWASLRLPRGQGLDYGWFVMTFSLLPPALLFPQVAGWLILGRTRYSSGVRYFMMMVLCLLVYIFTSILTSMDDRPIYPLLAYAFPPVAWVYSTFHFIDSPEIEKPATIIAGISSAITMLLVCARALKYWQGFTKLEFRAANSLQARDGAPVRRATVATPPGSRPQPVFPSQKENEK